MPRRSAVAHNQDAIAAGGNAAAEAEVNAMSTSAQMFQPVLTDAERVARTARDDANDFCARPRGVKPASPLHNDAPVCWNTRLVDLAGLRQWFIRRAAQEALKELQQEEQHVQHER
jgi:hypothetical protein